MHALLMFRTDGFLQQTACQVLRHHMSLLMRWRKGTWASLLLTCCACNTRGHHNCVLIHVMLPSQLLSHTGKLFTVLGCHMQRGSDHGQQSSHMRLEPLAVGHLSTHQLID